MKRNLTTVEDLFFNDLQRSMPNRIALPWPSLYTWFHDNLMKAMSNVPVGVTVSLLNFSREATTWETLFTTALRCSSDPYYAASLMPAGRWLPTNQTFPPKLFSVCKNIKTWNSPLSLCYNFVRWQRFQQNWNHDNDLKLFTSMACCYLMHKM